VESASEQGGKGKLPPGTFRSAGIIGATVATMLITDCNVRPAESVLDPLITNHLVVFSRGREYSTQKICFNKETFEEGNTKVEVDDASCKTAESACPELKDSKPCIKLQPTGRSPAGMAGYQLLFGVPEEKKNAKAVSDSLFVTATKPLSAAEYYSNG
jgi:hypothetical protein